MNLFNYWIEEKIKPVFKPKFWASPKKLALIVVLLAIIFFYLGQSLKQQPPANFKQVENLPEVKLPKVVLENLETKKPGVPGFDEAGQLQLLSANLIGIYEQQGDKATGNTSETSDQQQATSNTQEGEQLKGEDNPSLEDTSEVELSVSPSPSSSNLEPRTSNGAVRLAGLRILGEVKNIGQETVYSAKALVRFYGQSSTSNLEPLSADRQDRTSNSLLATKVAQFNQGYQFLPLSPGEINVYDLIVASQPESNTVTVELRAEDSKSSAKSPELSSDNFLKITSKKLEPLTIKKGETELTYYQFSCQLVNKSDAEIVNPGLYVWLKNNQGKVIGLTGKIFETDLLTPDQELEVKLMIAPVNLDEVFNFEVKTFGEKL